MNKIIWNIAVWGTVIMTIVMLITGKSLKTESTPGGIINLEWANTSTEVQQIFSVWKNIETKSGTAIDDAVKNTCLDFIFICCYTLLFFLCCKNLSRKYKTGSMLNIIGRILTGLCIVAAVLDLFENIGMLKSLAGNFSDHNAMFTAVSSVAKWIIVVLTILYIIIAFSGKLLRKIIG